MVEPNGKFEQMILTQLTQIHADIKELYRGQQDLAIQIAKISNPAVCKERHNELEQKVYNHYNEKDKSSHKNLMDLLKIGLGSGGVISVWELIKYVFHIKT
jgi:polyribonucleotide nucleotidyltransferase